MSIKKNLKIVGIASTLLALVSCGGSNDSKSSDRQKQDCRSNDSISCYSSLDWKIYLQGRSFPTKSRVEINGVTVVDECMTKSPFTIDRSVNPQMIAMTDFAVPTSKEVKIAVTDLGLCSVADDSSEFFPEANVPYDVVKSDRGALEVMINL